MYIKKLFFIFICIFFLFSCKENRKNFYFREIGTMLWISNEHKDSVVKMIVKETLENSSVIVAQIPWSPKDTTYFNNISWYKQLAENHGKTFMLNVDWQENNRHDTRGGWKFGNAKVRDQFKIDITRVVDFYKPDYLTLGVEVNYYALTNPDDYKYFIQTFNELKTIFSKKNTKLKVGLSFQLELLYGHHIDWKQIRTLEPLNAIVENLDYLGISTYPDSNSSYNKDFDNSVNYLDSIKSLYSLPIGISETGLITEKYNDDQRIKYIQIIYTKFNKLDLKFLIWGSIIDNPTKFSWENTIGLIDSQGKPKKEFQTWKLEYSNLKTNL